VTPQSQKAVLILSAGFQDVARAECWLPQISRQRFRP
jgi:hypothetical protein